MLLKLAVALPNDQKNEKYKQLLPKTNNTRLLSVLITDKNSNIYENIQNKTDHDSWISPGFAA